MYGSEESDAVFDGIFSGGATAKDVLDLIHEVQRRVLEQSGVMLEPEIKMTGEP